MTNIHHPAPINQFYRLDRDTPTSPWVKTTRWNNIITTPSGEKVNADPLNCMAAEGAVALDAHTLGVMHTSPAGIRNFQDDMSGGIGVDDVQVAWHRHFGQTLLTPGDYSWDDVMYAVHVQRRHVALGVDYRHVPYDYQVQKNGQFDHAIGIDDSAPERNLVLRFDSLDTKAVWTPESAYRGAAEALAIRIRGTRNSLFVGLTASRPLIAPPVVRVSIQPKPGYHGYPETRDFGIYTVVNGTITKRVGTTTGGFSANADRRGFYQWPGHSKQELVHITSGFLSGHNAWVLAKYVEG